MKEGWEYKKLGEVTNCQIGLTYKPTDVIDNGGIIVLRSSNIQDNKIALDDIVRVNCNISPSKYVKDGDILMCSRNGSFRLVGKVARIENLNEPMSYGAFMTIIRSDYNDFLFYFFQSESFRKQIFIGQTATINQITTKMLNSTSVVIPPLSEQQHVVEELDLLSSIIEKKKAQLNELDNLAQSLFYEMFGDPITNEKEWEFNSLKEVCLKINDGTHNSPVNEEKGDYMYVTAKNIKKDGIVLDNITFVSRNVHRSIYERCNPEFGDVLYIKDGVTTGIATINTLHDEFSLLSSVALLKPSNSIVNQYLKAVLNTPSMYNIIRSDMGGAAITRLTIAKINKIRIPVPPIYLQQQFASKIEAIVHQKELIKQSIKEVETLFNSRMDYYFS